jgi:hypothetical protein
MRYRIAGYTQEGPAITEVEWASLDQRLTEALAVANSSSASAVELQRAEGEIRLVLCQLAAQAAKKKLSRTVSGHKLNRDSCRAIFIESGCPVALVDRVVETFVKTDPAHHVGKDYEPSAHRIRQYHGTASELRDWVKKS